MKVKMIFIFLILFIHITGHNPTKADIKRVETLLDSAYAKTLVVDMKSSSLFAKKALKISRETGYLKGEAWSNFFIAQGLFELWAYKQSLHYLEKAENLNETIEDQYLSFEIFRVRSRVYGSLQLLDAAVREQKKGLEIIPDIPKNQQEKDFLTSLAYENLAITYNKIGNRNLSFGYLHKNKNLLERLAPDQVFTNLITLYTLLGNYYTEENQFSEAEFYLKKSEDLSKKYNYPYISFTYQNWGDLDLKKGNLKTAIAFYKKSLLILEQTNFKTEIPAVYRKLSVAYKKIGSVEESKDYQIKSLQLEAQLKTEQLHASSSAVEEILENEIQKVNQENSKTKTILITCSVLLVLVFFVCFKIIYDRRKNKSQERFDNKVIEDPVFSEDSNETIEDIICLAKSNSPEFLFRFQQFYPEFSKEIKKRYEDINVDDLRFSAYLKLNFSTKQIAEYTFVTIRSVQTRKSRLRKKLNIPSDEDIYLWMNSL